MGSARIFPDYTESVNYISHKWVQSGFAQTTRGDGTRAERVPVINGFSVIFNIRNNWFSRISVIFLIWKCVNFIIIKFRRKASIDSLAVLFIPLCKLQGLTRSSKIKWESVLLTFVTRWSIQDRPLGTEAAHRLLTGASVVLKSQRAYLRLEVAIVTQDLISHKSWWRLGEMTTRDY